MKKIFTCLMLLGSWLSWSFSSQAQDTKNSFGATVAKESIASGHSAGNGSGGNHSQNLFDIQFNYATAGQIVNGALAGVVYTGTEFWVARWNYDSLFTLNDAGVRTASFLITGVGTTTSGVRGMAYDGTFIYAGDNTNLIKKINPATKTLVSTITSQAPFGAGMGVRGIAWDSTANGGAGGFWVSNFGTAFYLLSMTGAILDSIPLSKHGVTSAYSIAFDPYTTGGPYIWAYDQTNSGVAATLVRVSRTNPQPTGNITHNTQTDIGAGSGLAGGLSITWRYPASGKKTIIGVQQSTLRLFGYELSDFTQAAIDASADSMFFTPPYTMVPQFEETPFNWMVKESNLGANSISDLATTFTINDGSSNVFTPAITHNMNFASGATVTNNFGPYTPAKGDFTVQAIVNTIGQTDASHFNDTVRYNMSITDSVMARDDNSPTGSLGLAGSDGGTLGQYFDLPNAAYITSVSYYCNRPSLGDTTNVDIYSFTGSPQSILASTPNHFFTLNDSLNGVFLTLPIAGGPMLVGPGSYFLGVNQHHANVSVGTSNFNFHPNTGWVLFGGTLPWVTTESVGFSKTFTIRLNIVSPTSVVEIAHEKFGIYPNPASTELTIESYQTKPDFKAEVYDLLGNKLMETQPVAAAKTTMDVSKLATGIYLVKTSVGDKFTTTKVSVVH